MSGDPVVAEAVPLLAAAAVAPPAPPAPPAVAGPIFSRDGEVLGGDGVEATAAVAAATESIFSLAPLPCVEASERVPLSGSLPSASSLLSMPKAVKRGDCASFLRRKESMSELRGEAALEAVLLLGLSGEPGGRPPLRCSSNLGWKRGRPFEGEAAARRSSKAGESDCRIPSIQASPAGFAGKPVCHQHGTHFVFQDLCVG